MSFIADHYPTCGRAGLFRAHGRLPLAIALALISPAALAQTPTPTAGSEPESEAITTLDQVRVEGFRGEQIAGVKYQRSLQETPRIITVLPETLLREQGATTLKDALRNQPGISLQAGEGNPPGGDQFKIRGFNARDDINVNGARDVGNYFRDPFFVDQIEVIKGPNSTFSGRGSAGGTVNLVTKLPTLVEGGNTELSIGQSSLRRLSVDQNFVLGPDSALRVNVMGHSAEMPGRDIAEDKRKGVYGAWTWGINGDTRLSADMLHLRQNDIPDAGLPFDRDPVSANSRGTGRLPPGLRFDNFYGHVDDYRDIQATLFGFTAEHRFESGVTLRNQLRLGQVENDSITSSPRIRNIPATSPGFAGAQARGDTKPRDQRDDSLSNQTSLVIPFSTGRFTHDLVTGLELGEFEYENRRRPDVSGPLTDLYEPKPRLRPATPYDGTVYRFKTREAAVYVLDTIRLAPQWDLHLGLRRDRVDARASEAGRENLPTPSTNLSLQRRDQVTSWNAGLVWLPSTRASYYVSVGNAFEISGNFDRNQIQLAGGANARVASPATFNIAPERTEALELGAKWLLGEDLALNAAIFQTGKDRARFPGQAAGDNSLLDAEIRLRGFELLAAGKLTPQWQLYAGYAYLDGEVLASPSRPFAVGQPLGGTPEHSYSLFSTYDLNPAFSVGGGVQYVGSQFSNVQATATGTLKVQIPSYTVYDVYAKWQFTPRMGLRINWLNVGDERYIQQLAEGGGQGIPGPGRQLVANLRYDY